MAYDVAECPQLLAVTACWRTLRDEAVTLTFGSQTTITVVPQGSESARVPTLMRVLSRIPGLRGAAISILPPGERASAANAELVGRWACVLTLAGGQGNTIELDDEQIVLEDGKLVAFPAAAARVMRNASTQSRIALWLLFDPSGVDSEVKQVARRAMFRIFGQGDVTVADALAAPQSAGRLRETAKRLHRSFSAIELEIDELVAESTKVACSWRIRGVHAATFWNVPATGARIAIAGTCFFTIEQQQIVAVGINWDVFGLLQQLRAALAEKPVLPRWVPVSDP